MVMVMMMMMMMVMMMMMNPMFFVPVPYENIAIN